MDKKMDEIYMRRCFELALLGKSKVEPNPMVGCVIVYDGRIIGEGYHREFGGFHAEVNAINSVKDEMLLSKSTLYVNLEPCSHHGKTPPCASLIVQKKISRVVISNLDPFPEVNGSGIEQLKEAGIEVLQGVLEEEGKVLNQRFFTFHKLKRPYIILKWAQTLDGFIDLPRKAEDANRPVWITNELSRHLVHKWRTEELGIMVGTITAERDNPKLNVRQWTGRNPIRIAIDRTLRLPNDLDLFDGEQPTLLIAGNNASSLKRKSNFSGIKQLEIIHIDFAKYFEHQLLEELYKRSVQSVIVEGGTKTIQNLVKLNLWDEARVFYADRFFYEGIKAPEFKGNIESLNNLWDSKLAVFMNKH